MKFKFKIESKKINYSLNFDIFKSLYSHVLGFFRFPHFAQDFEYAKLLWLFRLRCLAIFLFFFMSIPSFFYGPLNYISFVVYLGILAFLVLFNVLTYFVFIRNKNSISPIVLPLQMAVDLSVLSSLLFFTGGFENPFVALFLLHSVLGALLIRDKFSWPFILLCHSFVIALQIQYAYRHSFEYSDKLFVLFLMGHIMLFGVWLVMRSLGQFLEVQFEGIAQARIRIEKQDRLRSIGALAAGFSHEFASPLNAAKLRLDRLQDLLSTPPANAKILENINEAQKSILACEAVIHSMNSSQLDIRSHALKKIRILEFLHDVVDSWKEAFPNIEVKLDIQTDAEVYFSAINFAQVLFNLLDNAYEARPSGSIELKFMVENQMAYLYVKDNGPGFLKMVLDRQGEPFVTSKQSGTGLGLYVSEIFAQSMGGKLLLANHSSGAIVSIQWPLAMDPLNSAITKID